MTLKSVTGLCSRGTSLDLSLKYLDEHSPHKEFVRQLLSPTNYEKSLAMKDRICEILVLENDTPTGCIVYKKAIFKHERKKLFVVRSFKVLDQYKSEPKSSESCLIKRIIRLAKKVNADTIIMHEPEDTQLMEFVQSKGFSNFSPPQSTSSPFIDDLLCMSLTSSESSPNQQTISGRKRKRSSLPMTQENVTNNNNNEPFRKIEPPTKIRKIQSRTPKTHRLPMKGTIYFDYIMNGKKKYEGRVNASGCQKMKVGDRLRLFDRQAGWGIICEITSKDNFDSFTDMLESKGVLSMLPQLEDKAKTLSKRELIREGVKIYKAFPGSQRVHRVGCSAIGVKFLEKI